MDHDVERAEQGQGDGESGSEPFQHLREFYERVSAQFVAGSPQRDEPDGQRFG